MVCVKVVLISISKRDEVMVEYIKCPKCDGEGEYHDETMDLGKEKLVTCNICKGQQEIKVNVKSMSYCKIKDQNCAVKEGIKSD